MRRAYILFAITWLCASVAFAQPISKSSYETLIETAEAEMAKQEYYNALEKYEEAYEESEDKALRLTIAQLHFSLRDYRKAERWYKRVLSRDKKNEYAAERFTYGRILKMNEKYEDAIAELQKFIGFTDDETLKELAQAEITGAEMALEGAGSTQGVKIENLGRKVNSSLSEYSPTFSRGGGEIYFAALEGKEVIVVDEKNTDYHAKIYKVAKEDKGWGKPKALSTKVNRPGVHNANVTFSDDGKRMYFDRIVLQGNQLHDSKIYYSEEGDGEWLGAKEVVGVNGEFTAKQAAVGELFGKEVLFFVSNMDGTYGGFDIFYAPYKGDGVYGDPVNLGPKINTVGDEETPFYKDGTLYFSSTGHPGLGGYDIFYAVWNGATWSEPANMGRGYNTSVDDLYFSLDSEGYSGLLTSNRPGGRSVKSKTCCDDIYSFTIPRKFVDLVVGVFDQAKKPLKGATVQLVQVQNNVVGKTDSQSKQDGNRYDYPLDFDMAYMVVASKEGFFPDTVTLNTVGLEDSKSFRELFYLKAKPVPPPEPEYDTITIEEAFVLENILYDFDDDRIKTEAESDLQIVLELMQKHADMKIELGSHTDFRGNNDYNADLSQRRAESARRWLVRKGVSRSRIEAKGYGESVPKTVSAKVAAQNDFLKEGDVLTEEYINKLATEEQKEQAHYINRRTEFKITEGPTSVTIKRTRLKKKPVEQPKVNPKKRKRPRGRNALPKSYIKTKVKANNDPVEISEMSSLYGKKSLKGVPIMQFKERTIDFGVVPKGEKRYHTFEFTNEGDTDLIISIVSACECTIADYSTQPVKPGGSSYIDVTFDSAEKDEAETISIDIFLENEEPDTGNPIMEQIKYKFDIKK